GRLGAVNLRLGTRGSALARAQAALAAAALAEAGVTDLETVLVRTHGDRHPETAVEELSGQGWFTAELQRALRDGEVDLAVHSYKDLAVERPEGLGLAAVMPRADPRDAVVTRDGVQLAGLPAGSRVGTSSRRRSALLAALHPELLCVAIRGNVDTRLRKLDGGEVDALLLAGAGLDRLGLGERAVTRLDPVQFVPAPAQGAIAIEARAGSEAEALARAIDDRPSRLAVAAERAVLAALGGGCLLPLGAWAEVAGERLTLHATLAGEDGTLATALVVGSAADPEDAGRRAAAMLG
ncbi:MAG: hydroxymethylbilane synthase, partial [Candidatus Dormibacteraeota bacterium]|nr:hydroxymethylbilane synthase [Candidatus Dormibacteraeota bacterium]